MRGDLGGDNARSADVTVGVERLMELAGRLSEAELVELVRVAEALLALYSVHADRHS